MSYCGKQTTLTALDALIKADRNIRSAAATHPVDYIRARRSLARAEIAFIDALNEFLPDGTTGGERATRLYMDRDWGHLRELLTGG